MTQFGQRLWRAYEQSPPVLKDVVATLHGAWQRQRRYGSFFRAHRLALEESQWWSPEQVAFATGDRLRRFAHRAATTVPYYRDLFLYAEVAPQGIREVEDLRRLPFLEWETVRREHAQFLPEADDAGAAVLLRTSGPEKAALSVPVTQECFEREWAFRWQQLSWRGIKPGERTATLADDPLVVTLGPEPPVLGDQLRRERDVTLLPASEAERTLPIYAARLSEWQPVLLHGPPSALYLARRGPPGRGGHLDPPPRRDCRR